MKQLFENHRIYPYTALVLFVAGLIDLATVGSGLEIISIPIVLAFIIYAAWAVLSRKIRRRERGNAA